MARLQIWETSNVTSDHGKGLAKTVVDQDEGDKATEPCGVDLAQGRKRKTYLWETSDESLATSMDLEPRKRIATKVRRIIKTDDSPVSDNTKQLCGEVGGLGKAAGGTVPLKKRPTD